MEKSFKVVVNKDSTYKLKEETIHKLDIVELTSNTFHILENNKSYMAEIISENFNSKKYSISVNNNEYEVDIQTSLDDLIKDLGFEIGSSKQINAIKAPMPGLILSINVEVGQVVVENENLLILEAMKMENVFSSPRAGTIKSIQVKKGDAVEKGQLLIEFE